MTNLALVQRDPTRVGQIIIPQQFFALHQCHARYQLPEGMCNVVRCIAYVMPLTVLPVAVLFPSSTVDATILVTLVYKSNCAHEITASWTLKLPTEQLKLHECLALKRN